MADQAIATISNGGKNHTATYVADLLHSYEQAHQMRPEWTLRPGRVEEALRDPSRRFRAIFLLSAGARALNCLLHLECGDGDSESRVHTTESLRSLAYDLYKEAEYA